MLNPGAYTLLEMPLTAANNAVAMSSITDLEGMQAVTLEAQLGYGSGGTTCKVWVQTTLDNGQTWIDIACFAFGAAGGIKVVNLSGMTPVTTAFAPSDGALADNTFIDGVLGTALRAKITSTGTYASSGVAVRACAR